MACPARVLMWADRIDKTLGGQCPAEGVEQAGPIGRPYLDHRRALAGVGQ